MNEATLKDFRKRLDQVEFTLEEAYDHTDSVKTDDLQEVTSRLKEALKLINSLQVTMNIEAI